MIRNFDSRFSFGVADADLQVIGEEHTLAHEGSQPTMWSRFAEDSGKCFNREGPGRGIDRFHRWEEDAQILIDLGIRHYRTSVSMARVLNRDGSVNPRAIEWYRRYFARLKSAGFTIYATLYHWELPQAVLEQGGWLTQAAGDALVRHAKAVATELGDLIDVYFILNEPWCSSLLSYHLGIHAPGHTSLKEGLAAAHNLLLANGAACDALLAIDRNLKVGTVFNTEPAYPASKSDEDARAARYWDGYFNRWFFDALFLGRYPEDMREVYGSAFPEAGAADMRQIQVGSRLTIMGINQYCGRMVKFDANAELRSTPVLLPGGRTNGLGWPIFYPPLYPRALYDFLCQAYSRYGDAGLKRIFVSENGTALRTPWDRSSKLIDDEPRITYLTEHISQVHDAIAAGVPVEGYFVWTLMDNYEWAEGYRPDSCFGMVHVDRETLTRVKKKSAVWFGEVARSGTLKAKDNAD
jgi:beta-glucosidase